MIGYQNKKHPRKAHLFWSEGSPILWAQPHFKLSCGLTSENFKFSLEIMDTVVSRLKRSESHLACYQHTAEKPASVMVWGRICAHCICEDTINAEWYGEASADK